MGGKLDGLVFWWPGAGDAEAQRAKISRLSLFLQFPRDFHDQFNAKNSTKLAIETTINQNMFTYVIRIIES